MSNDYDVEVTIYDENIPIFWLKKIQKLKAALLEEHWHVGTIQQKENIIRFHERQVLDHNVHIYWYEHQTIRIVAGHSFNRDNLKLMEKILGRKSDLDLSQKGNIRASFDCGKTEPNEYEKFKVFKTRFDIPRMLDGYNCEIYGYKWNDEIEI